MVAQRPFYRESLGRRPADEETRKTMRAPLIAINTRIDEMEVDLKAEIAALKTEVADLQAEARRRKGGRPKKAGPKTAKGKPPRNEQTAEATA